LNLTISHRNLLYNTISLSPPSGFFKWGNIGLEQIADHRLVFYGQYTHF